MASISYGNVDNSAGKSGSYDPRRAQDYHVPKQDTIIRRKDGDYLAGGPKMAIFDGRHAFLYKRSLRMASISHRTDDISAGKLDKQDSWTGKRLPFGREIEDYSAGR